jgi:hypothetical protein
MAPHVSPLLTSALHHADAISGISLFNLIPEITEN